MKRSIHILMSGMILIIAMILLLPAAAYAQTPTEAEAYNKMIALKADYPEGTPWTNDNYYQWKGGIYSGGHGCAGFAFMLSDAAFDDLRARKYTTIDYDALKVGDILRSGGDTHSMIILQKFDDKVVIAEGNYNSSIHWGRVLTKNEVLSSSYYITRYPETDHSYGAWKVTKEPTCTQPGSKKRICSSCGQEDTQVIPATGHVWSDSYTVDRKPTCKQEGSESIHCSVCGAVKEGSARAVEKTEHSIVRDPAVEPTCTTEGKTEGSHCGICGDVIVKQETVHATGHSLTEHPEVPATGTSKGTKAYWTCSKCGKMFSDANGNREISGPEHTDRLSGKTQQVVVTTSGKSVKASSLKKKARTVAPLTVSGAEGDVRFSITGGKAKARKVLKINGKTGKVTVKKKTAKGTYTVKVKVSVSGTDEYEPFSRTVTVTVKVKK